MSCSDPGQRLWWTGSFRVSVRWLTDRRLAELVNVIVIRTFSEWRLPSSRLTPWRA